MAAETVTDRKEIVIVRKYLRMEISYERIRSDLGDF